MAGRVHPLLSRDGLVAGVIACRVARIRLLVARDKLQTAVARSRLNATLFAQRGVASSGSGARRSCEHRRRSTAFGSALEPLPLDTWSAPSAIERKGHGPSEPRDRRRQLSQRAQEPAITRQNPKQTTCNPRHSGLSAAASGEVPEWSNGAVSKTVDPSRGPRVRIPVSPPFQWLKFLFSARKPKNLPPEYPPPRQGLSRKETDVGGKAV